jgi:hypothetical protein
MPTRSWPRFAGCSWVALATLLVAGRLPAQESASSYDARALRIERGLWSDRLVQGTRAEKIKGLGMFPDRIELFTESGDSARRYYDSFRVRKNRSSWLFIGAFGLLGASFIAGLEETPGVVFLIGSLGVAVSSGVASQRAANDLSRAVWWYNRESR